MSTELVPLSHVGVIFVVACLVCTVLASLISAWAAARRNPPLAEHLADTRARLASCEDQITALETRVETQSTERQKHIDLQLTRIHERIDEMASQFGSINALQAKAHELSCRLDNLIQLMLAARQDGAPTKPKSTR